MFYVRMCVVGCLRISLTSRIGEDDEIVLLWCVSAESRLRALAVFARVFLCKMRDNSLPSHNPCPILSRPVPSRLKWHAYGRPGPSDQIVRSLPESRDLANSMRLLASICRVGDALLPTVQRLVAATLLVGEYDAAAAAASGEASGFSSQSCRTSRTADSTSSGSSIAQGRDGGDSRVNSGSFGANDEKEEKGEGIPSREGETESGSRGVDGNRGSISFKRQRSLFEYDLLSNTGARGRSDEDRPFSYGRSHAPWWSPDGTRGIRVKLKMLIKDRSPLEIQLRRLQELLAQSRASSGSEAVIFEAWLEGGGSSRTVVRVVNRGGVDELPVGRGGAAAANSAGGDLLEYFVESVKLLSTLCRERHAENIDLIRNLKGTSYKVCFEQTVILGGKRDHRLQEPFQVLVRLQG